MSLLVSNVTPADDRPRITEASLPRCESNHCILRNVFRRKPLNPPTGFISWTVLAGKQEATTFDMQMRAGTKMPLLTPRPVMHPLQPTPTSREEHWNKQRNTERWTPSSRKRHSFRPLIYISYVRFHVCLFFPHKVRLELGEIHNSLKFCCTVHGLHHFVRNLLLFVAVFLPSQ